MTVTLEAFDAAEIDPAAFSHRDHLAVAFEALRQDEFFAASARIARGLRGLAAKAGAPEKYSATITLAFISLVAERMQEGQDFDAFLAANPELLNGALKRLYSSQRLADPRGRSVALLPDLGAAAA
ncbi:hypothetical protein [Acidimangrovimonas pyrenivorans]|uniref:Uncharacterized protein n=1 Tax=Acidimangrovimonas pyrenivorans TaxID=2030798 RepID=A0ABV7ALN9_9RHOB